MNLIEIPKNEGAYNSGALEAMCNALILKANADLQMSNSTFVRLDYGIAMNAIGKEDAQKVSYGAEKEAVLSTVANAYHAAGYFVRVKFNCVGSLEGFYINRVKQMNVKYRLVNKF